MEKYAIGIDVGGTTVKIGIFKNESELIKKWEIQTRIIENGKYIIDDIYNSINEMIETIDISIDNIIGIGIGVPGPVLEDGVVYCCDNLGWGIFNIEKAISERFNGIKVKAGNDANLATLGEIWKGGGTGFKNAVLVTLGTGVGGGIVIDGKIHNGKFGSAGEIGHILVKEEETELCGCGKKGCLEQYASATGIVRHCKKLLQEKSVSSELRNIEPLTAKIIFDYAKDGDEIAIETVMFFGNNLGKALSYISCTIDPEVFIIGGGVSNAGEYLIEVVKEYYIKYAFHASKNTEFKLALLGNDAGIFGAVKLIIDCQE